MVDFSISQLGANKPLCPNARSYGQLIEQVVFIHLSAESTPAEYQQAQNLLLAMCERFATSLTLFHFPVAVGTHWCVRDVYEDASCRLACLAALRKPPPKPEPAPEPQPAPMPEPLSDAELMERLQNYVTERATETFFGQDQEEEAAEESA